MISRTVTALVALAVVLLAFGALTEAATPVDCTKPTTDLQKKIVAGTKPLELVIKGTCIENLVIERATVGTASPACVTPTYGLASPQAGEARSRA